MQGETSRRRINGVENGPRPDGFRNEDELLADRSRPLFIGLSGLTAGIENRDLVAFGLK